MSTLLPNTFQCFNLYIDRALEHLTDSEVRILWYATRHILGWQDKIKKRHGHISLTMFEHGYTAESGKHYGGCGLGRGAIITACNSLVEFKFLARIGEPTEDGQEWELITDDIQWAALEARTIDKTDRLKAMTKKATQARKDKRASTSNVPAIGGTFNVTTPSTSNVTMQGTSNVPNQRQNSKPDTKPSSADALHLPKYPRSIRSYMADHIERYNKEHITDMTALVLAWHGDMYTTGLMNVGVSDAREYIEVHKEMLRLNKPCADYLALVKYTKKKEQWLIDKGGKIPVKAMLKYVTDYVPIVPKVYDDPSMDLSIPQEIIPILVREAANHHG